MPKIRRGPPTDESWRSYEARFPNEKVAVAKSLCERLAAYGTINGVLWTPALRPAYFGFYMTRPGQTKRHFVAGASLFKERDIAFCVKFSERPVPHRLETCYPELDSWWNPVHKQWEWSIPDLGAVPNVGRAVDLSTVPRDLMS